MKLPQVVLKICFLFIILLYSIFYSCASKVYITREGKKITIEEAAQIEYKKGVTAYFKEKNLRKAIKIMDNLCEEFSRTFYCSRGKVFVVQALFKNKLWRRAAKRAIEFIHLYPENSFVNEIKYYLVKSMIKLKRMDYALKYAKSIKLKALKPEKRYYIKFLLAEFDYYEGDYDECFIKCIDLFRRDTPFRQQCSIVINNILDKVDAKIFNRYIKIVRNFSSFAFVMLHLADLTAEQGNLSLAVKYLKEARSSGIPWLTEQINKRIKQIEDGINERDSLRIGVLLPLSGNMRWSGEEVLKGIAYAFGTGLTSSLSKDIKLQIEDTGNSPEYLIDAFFRFMQDSSPVVILGPLTSFSSELLIPHINVFEIPMISFTQKEGISEKSEFAFKFNETPSILIKSTVDYLFESLGFSRFSILFPEDEYGKYMMNLFWDYVESKGGVIASARGYDPRNIDIKDDIKMLVGTYYRDVAEKEAEEKGIEIDENFEPEVHIDFEAIFIPDTPKKSAFIARQLAYEGVSGVTLIGTNLWNNDSFVEIGERFVEGALFSTGFFSDTVDPITRKFVEDFMKQYTTPPLSRTAYAYEITKKILGYLDKSLRSSQDVKNYLLNLNERNGVIGAYYIDKTGRLIDDVKIISVEGGKFVER